jgi:hypothetical protein
MSASHEGVFLVLIRRKVAPGIRRTGYREANYTELWRHT